MTDRVMAVVHDFDHLVRFHQLGFVCVWPLLGWACVRDWSAIPILWLFVVVFFWHSFSAVINDIVDVNAPVLGRFQALGSSTRACSRANLPALASEAPASPAQHPVPYRTSVRVRRKNPGGSPQWQTGFSTRA